MLRVVGIPSLSTPWAANVVLKAVSGLTPIALN
jgi:hypothetical protein